MRNNIASCLRRLSRVEKVAQPVAQHVDGQQGGEQEDAGKEHKRRPDLPERAGVGENIAPGRRGGTRAGADEGKRSLEEKGGAPRQRPPRRSRRSADSPGRGAPRSSARPP